MLLLLTLSSRLHEASRGTCESRLLRIESTSVLLRLETQKGVAIIRLVSIPSANSQLWINSWVETTFGLLKELVVLLLIGNLILHVGS